MPDEPWTPSLAQVGALLRARTRDSNGNEVGTFTGTTRPTSDQAESLIEQAVADVIDTVGQAIPADLYNGAAMVATIGAAMLIELSFFPEQVATSKSPYMQLQTQYKDRLERLMLSVEHEGADVPGTEYMTPAGAFGGNPLPVQWWTNW